LQWLEKRGARQVKAGELRGAHPASRGQSYAPSPPFSRGILSGASFAFSFEGAFFLDLLWPFFASKMPLSSAASAPGRPLPAAPAPRAPRPGAVAGVGRPPLAAGRGAASLPLGAWPPWPLAHVAKPILGNCW
jgi:hypothetical protein